jgi:hypothetical protein
MLQCMSELLKCYKDLRDESDKNHPERVVPSTTSGRAKNELFLILAANNLPNFTESEPFRELTIRKTVSIDEYKDNQ